MQQFPIYLTISLCFSIPILGLVLAKGFLETDARLTYIGNYTNCLTMFICQFSELCLITTIHFWLSFLFRKIRKAPLIVLDGFFISTYIHITFLELSEFNAGLSGMQFTTPSLSSEQVLIETGPSLISSLLTSFLCGNRYIPTNVELRIYFLYLYKKRIIIHATAT